jgi:transposase
MLHAALDAHKRYSQVAVRNEHGQIVDERRLWHEDKDSMRRYFLGLPGPKVAVLEAGRNWYWIYDLLEECFDEVKLSHPAKTRVIAEAKVKTDKIDARMLSELSRTGFLAEAYVPPGQVRSDRELHRYRVSLTCVSTKLKNRVHAVLAKLGIEQPWSDLFGKQGRVFLSGLELGEPYREEVDSCLRLIDAIKCEEKQCLKRIKKSLRQDERAKVLMSVPGIAERLAYLVLCEVGDIGRFRTVKHFVSYSTLAPTTRQSAGRVWHGHVGRHGNLYLKYAFIEAAKFARKKDPALKALYESVLRGKGKSKATVAVARKVAVAVYHILKTGESYRYNELTKRHLGKPMVVPGRKV